MRRWGWLRSVAPLVAVLAGGAVLLYVVLGSPRSRLAIEQPTPTNTTTTTTTTLPTPSPVPSAPSEPLTDAPSCVPALSSHSLLVLTLNIHSGSGDLAQIAAEIQAWQADVVLLQEVDRDRTHSGNQDQAAWLGEKLGMHAVFGANAAMEAAHDGRPAGMLGNAILSRFPVTDSANLALPRPAGTQQRGLLRATIDLGDQLVDVYATHLDHTSPDARIPQAQAIHEVVRTDPLPHIVGGDFNAVSDSPAYRIVARGLRDTWLEIGEGDGLTVPPNVPQRRIDYVLHTADFEPLQAVVIRSAVSDHRAVRAQLLLQVLDPCASLASAGGSIGE